MNALPTDAATLCAVVFLLGLRHGFDADHLAAIDGMTRLQALGRRAWGRWCGALFSLGHGAVVVAIGLLVGASGQPWQAPAWLGSTGLWISVSALLFLGIANLRALLVAAPGAPVAPVGLKGRWLARWLQARSPGAVAGVGALFALSFDTVSQAAMFAWSASALGGAGAAGALGLVFTAGMLATDALNGWCIARLIARADQLAAIASRVMGGAVAAVSLGVAALALARKASAALDGWAGHQGLLIGAVVLAVLGASYGLAWLLAAAQIRGSPNNASSVKSPA